MLKNRQLIGAATDLALCKLTHFDLAAQLELFKRLNYKYLVFDHVENEGLAENGRKECKRLTKMFPYPCTLASDGDVFTI